jgi:hypothetical protein
LSIFRTRSLISERVQKYSLEASAESTEKFERVQLSGGRPMSRDKFGGLMEEEEVKKTKRAEGQERRQFCRICSFAPFASFDFRRRGGDLSNVSRRQGGRAETSMPVSAFSL